MGRWTQYDEDSYRLPEGVSRIGYDADTGQYRYTGGLEGAPYSRYGFVSASGTPSRWPSVKRSNPGHINPFYSLNPARPLDFGSQRNKESLTPPTFVRRYLRKISSVSLSKAMRRAHDVAQKVILSPFRKPAPSRLSIKKNKSPGLSSPSKQPSKHGDINTGSFSRPTDPIHPSTGSMMEKRKERRGTETSSTRGPKRNDSARRQGSVRERKSSRAPDGKRPPPQVHQHQKNPMPVLNTVYVSALPNTKPLREHVARAQSLRERERPTTPSRSGAPPTRARSLTHKRPPKPLPTPPAPIPPVPKHPSIAYSRPPSRSASSRAPKRKAPSGTPSRSQSISEGKTLAHSSTPSRRERKPSAHRWSQPPPDKTKSKTGRSRRTSILDAVELEIA